MLLGQQCEVDVDECQFTECVTHAYCVNTHGSFRCDCLFGYEGELATCTCISSCMIVLVYLHVWLFTHIGLHVLPTYVCENVEYCLSLFSLFQGNDCNDIVDFCEPEPCVENAFCTSEPLVWYTCTCIPGFYGDIKLYFRLV